MNSLLCCLNNNNNYNNNNNIGDVLNSFAPPASFPSATSPANGRAFPAANSPGPIELYNSGQESLGYVQATSPQPSGFGPSITANRGPLITASYHNGYH
uniref:Uncharacterized protein n=1 Tax=Octopus bimaculoides TaxID=37653 RepID=A0A0L8H8Y1_OCTBM